MSHADPHHHHDHGHDHNHGHHDHHHTTGGHGKKPPIHPGWLYGTGIVLTILVIVVWTML